MVSVLAKTRPEDWKYLAEGAETIVCAYAGPPHPDFDKMVIRLNKTCPDLVEGEPTNAGSLLRPSPLYFRTRVIERLVPGHFLSRHHLVSVEASWLISLNAVIAQCRPLDRRLVSVIDSTALYTTLMPDLTSRSGLCVEIKPKWGFMPNPEYLGALTKPLKNRYCRHCMHARLKLREGKPCALRYCPLDLYSNTEARIRRALSALWIAWVESNSTVNNLKLFVGGSLVSPRCKESLEGLRQELQSPTQGSNDLQEAFIRKMTPILLNSPVLSFLADVQRLLDPIDIEGIRLLWERLRPSDPFDNLPIFLPEPTIEDWEIFLDQYLALNSSVATDDVRSQDLSYYLLSYVLSATFKDVSIMVDGTHDAGATLVDLGAKHLGKIPEWYALDQTIVKNARENETLLTCSNEC